MTYTQLCLSLSSHTSFTRAFVSCVNREMHVVYMKCTHCGYGCECCRSSTFSPSSPKKTKTTGKKKTNNNNRPGAKCHLSMEHKETVAAWTEGKSTLMLFILLTPSKRVSPWTTSNHSNCTRHHCVGFFFFFFLFCLVCRSVYIMSPVFTVLLTDVCVTTGCWSMNNED